MEFGLRGYYNSDTKPEMRNSKWQLESAKNTTDKKFAKSKIKREFWKRDKGT